jgi:hypothetical protein
MTGRGPLGCRGGPLSSFLAFGVDRLFEDFFDLFWYLGFDPLDPANMAEERLSVDKALGENARTGNESRNSMRLSITRVMEPCSFLGVAIAFFGF